MTENVGAGYNFGGEQDKYDNARWWHNFSGTNSDCTADYDKLAKQYCFNWNLKDNFNKSKKNLFREGGKLVRS